MLTGMFCKGGFLSNTGCRVISMSAAFSIKLGDVLHRFLYNHIKQQYCTYKTIHIFAVLLGALLSIMGYQEKERDTY